jgi:hypothetical protein
MGEDEKKPKIEVKKHSWKPSSAGGNRPKLFVKFKAPTPGHEDDIFTCGQAFDAANFEEVCKKLARYCAVNFKSGGAMVRKAIEEMTALKIDPPADLPATATKMQEKVWETDYDEYRRKLSVWNDASELAYQLFLSYCQQDVEQKIVSSDHWDSVNNKQDLIALLKMIRDTAHQHDEIKGGTMQVVEQDIMLHVYGFQK